MKQGAVRNRCASDLPVWLRSLPYPYRAMLSICSDLDETPDRRVYWEIMRFLNTAETTSSGSGVSLEVGNSIYFDMPAAQFSYWNTDDAGREMVRTLIQSGHIDCLHSYGDSATTRAHAGRALDELARHDCRIPVWVDHSKAPTNFGPDIMCGHGDEEGHPAYHADLTRSFGIRYVWRGRTTSILGQDIAPRLGGIFHPAHAVESPKTLAKQAAKLALARFGSRKYSMHGLNRVLRPSALRDGQPIHEFMRSNPHWGGVSCCDGGRGIGQVLTQSMLDRLVRRGGVCVLYTHLGKIHDPNTPFDASARDGFWRLAAMQREGKILVLTTHRLLRNLTVRQGLRYRAEPRNGRLIITAEGVEDPITGPRDPRPEDLQGITFCTRPYDHVELASANHTTIPCEVTRVNGRMYIAVPWKPLEFPRL